MAQLMWPRGAYRPCDCDGYRPDTLGGDSGVRFATHCLSLVYQALKFLP